MAGKKEFVPPSKRGVVPKKKAESKGELPTPRATKLTTLANAPLVKLATLTSWSYSVYTSYMKCPLAVCFEKIKRIKIFEPENPSFVKGNYVHKGAEAYIKTEGKKEPKPIPELQHVTERLSFHRRAKSLLEPDWSFTKDWLLSRYNDWDNCWLRIKVDAVAVIPPTKKEPPLIHITDWKTGKVYDDHKQQRSIYALGALQLVELGELAEGNKDVRVIAEHLYTDTTQSATEEYTMKDFAPLKREWMTRIKQMMSDTTYRPKPGYHCRWCRFRKSNGGPCPEEQ